ncbi:hypothetical protein RI129_001389 [Pyrocoelia pectoralis]|uniref:Serpin domain-containing protein n=1 Tax=Pyrocoelia pectoralis TaxID=417401 RepID=A0AAN7ZJZ1_9COLE
MKIIILLSMGFLLTRADQVLKNYQDGNIKFTSDVYRELSKSASGNILMCPLSVEIVLAMVFSGAKGETAKQLSLATHLPNDQEEVVEMFSELIPQLESSDKYTFESANKIYVQNTYKVQEQYNDIVVNKFKSEIESIDFVSPNAASNMNEWVEKKTHNKITNLINQDDLDEDSRLMIVNAMYFKGQWVKGFKESSTEPKPFFLNSTHYIDTDMMSNKGSYKYYEDTELKAKFLEIPYKGNDVSMIIALPDNPEDINTLENNMDIVLKPKFEHLVNINIRIPKFEIKESIKFKKILQSLGAVLPFEDGANFDVMIPTGTFAEPLKIAEIVQKAVIEVDEKGTVAAASSAAHMQTWRSGKIFPDTYFYADHPFIFFIKHKTFGVTFIGRYCEPKGIIQTGKYEAPVDSYFKNLKVQIPTDI